MPFSFDFDVQPGNSLLLPDPTLSAHYHATHCVTANAGNTVMVTASGVNPTPFLIAGSLGSVGSLVIPMGWEYLFQNDGVHWIAEPIVSDISAYSTGCIPTTVGLDTFSPAANVNNLVLPPGDVGYRFLSASNRNLTGMVAGIAGECVHFFNGNTANNSLSIIHNSSLSLAANRFFCPEAVDYSLGKLDFITFQYDAILSRWVAIGSAGHP